MAQIVVSGLCLGRVFADQLFTAFSECSQLFAAIRSCSQCPELCPGLCPANGAVHLLCPAFVSGLCVRGLVGGFVSGLCPVGR